MAGTGHLVKRFFGSLSPRGPKAEDTEWVKTQLLPGEWDLWLRMSSPDRRHAVGVARRVQRALGDEATRPVIAAALLHDVGKITSGLGTYGRVMATLSAKAAGRDTARAWSDVNGYTRRIGLYLLHDELGVDLLRLAGSDELTVTWAGEHHLPEDQWTVPPRIGAALKAADDD